MNVRGIDNTRNIAAEFQQNAVLETAAANNQSQIEQLTDTLKQLMEIVKQLITVVSAMAQGQARANSGNGMSNNPFSVPAGGDALGSRSSGSRSNADYSAGDIYRGFYQGQEGNCVSVGAIKAAMVAFGPDQVFQNVQRTANGVDVTMRDGQRVQLTNSELALARQHGNFRGTDSNLINNATVMYAAMAKRAQMEGNDGLGRMNYVQALNSLNNGENYLEGPHWLGLDGYVQRIDPSQMNNYAASVGASNSHVVFNSGGVIDSYGNRERFNGTDGNGNRLNWAYAIVP